MKFNLILALIVLVAGFLFALNQIAPPERSDSIAIGLEKTDCWFDKKPWELFTFCYYMNVPEDHGRPEGRMIQFPVVYFKSHNVFADKAPVLHLGGGGPGGPMYLDYDDGVRSVKEEHDDFSLKQGRDLIIIDMRGTGLAKPSLGCQHLVELQFNAFQQDLSFAQEWDLHEASYLQCIDEFKRSGHNLTHYNSTSVAKDTALLNRSLKTNKFVLFGVSYGAVYAQEIARNTPEIVESMILDSAAFPHISMNQNYVNRTLAPYRALYGYCSIINTCSDTAENTRGRIWSIYRQLKQQPIEMNIVDYNTGESLKAVLNGDRFIASLFSGVYSMAVFYDLPQIIEELEVGRTETIKPYFEDYATFMLDPQWGDVSAQAHYCSEVKPFIDMEKMRESINSLPAGYIRESTLLYFEANDFCQEMEISAVDSSFGEGQQINVPTLFLHGKYDSITPLSDVTNEMAFFKNSRLLTYASAHSVMSAEECAELSAGVFVADPSAEDLSCQ